MRLIAAGVAGAFLKKVMDLVPDYDKTAFTVIPLGTVTDDKTGKEKAVYFTIPIDDTGRMIGGTFWHMLNQDGGMKAIQGMLGVPLGNTPSLAPVLNMASKWGQYAAGENPRDDFRQRDIVGKDAWAAGGLYAARDMIAWQLDQFGVISTISHQAVRSEDEWAAVAEEDSTAAIARLALSDRVRRVGRERYRLNRLGDGKIDPKDTRRRAFLNEWYSDAYLPITEAIKLAQDHGDEERAAALRDQLDALAQRIESSR